MLYFCAIAIIISLLIVKKMKISNLWMIPIVIAEIIVYGMIIMIWKMAIPIVLIALVLAAIYLYQHLLPKD